MATENVSYGWQGKIARVNLTTGEITTQSTDPYKYFLGGMGLANKIMYDEVPEGTDPFSPESKVVMAVGPLTASGTPLAGRTTFSHLSTFTTDHLVVDSHCGGMIGAKLKLAGWDALIIEGASDKPVYIKILNDKITIEDASFVWGMGTRAPPPKAFAAKMATSSPLPPLAPQARICCRMHASSIRATTRQALAWAPSWALKVQGNRHRGRRQRECRRPEGHRRAFRLHDFRHRGLQQQPRRTFHPAGMG